MKMNWTKEFPKIDGWYWCKYFQVVIVPVRIITISGRTWANTARGDTFYSDDRFNSNQDLVFGSKIEEPT